MVEPGTAGAGGPVEASVPGAHGGVVPRPVLVIEIAVLASSLLWAALHRDALSEAREHLGGVAVLGLLVVLGAALYFVGLVVLVSSIGWPQRRGTEGQTTGLRTRIARLRDDVR